MAVKRTRRVRVAEVAVPVVEESPVFENREMEKRVFPKWVIAVLAGILGLVLFWYKTNTWPVVAVVGLRPVTRFEIDQSLFAKGGVTEIENKVTEIKVSEELKRMNISVSDDEVEAKINEIKTGLGDQADIESILQNRGLTLDDYRAQLRLLMGAEKAVADKIQVTDEEAASYLEMTGGEATDAAQLANAKEMVRLSKVDEEIGNWVKGLEDKYKVWKLPGM